MRQSLYDSMSLMDLMIDCVKLGITNCWIIKENGNTILVDSGVSRSISKLQKKLNNLGIEKDSVAALIQTHCHFDHIGLSARIKEYTKCKIIVNKSEASWITGRDKPVPGGFNRWGRVLNRMMNAWVPRMDIQPFEGDILQEGELDLGEYGIEGKIIHTPGHTIGSSSVVLDSGEAFVGDLAMSGLPKIIGKGTPMLGDDLSMIYQNWEKLIGLGISKIYPGHGKPFDVAVLENILENRQE